MAERDFKGVWIPKEIWLDTRLNALDKIILAEVDSLDMSDKGCFASNEALAEFAQCSVTKITRSISTLIQLGCIEVLSFDGRRRVLGSRLVKKTRQTRQKDEESNTSISTDIERDIPNGISGKKTFAPPTVEEVKAYCAERNNNVNALKWHSFYASKGWMVGKNKMKDWKAAVITWEQSDEQPKRKQDRVL